MVKRENSPDTNHQTHIKRQNILTNPPSSSSSSKTEPYNSPSSSSSANTSSRSSPLRNRTPPASR